MSVIYEGLDIRTKYTVYAPGSDSLKLADFLKPCLSGIRIRNPSMLELGTGSGILSLVALRNMKFGKAVFADINERAVRLAKSNFKLNKHKLMVKKAVFVKSDLFQNIKGRFDLIVFNTPYVPRMAYLPPLLFDFINGGKLSWDGGGATGIELCERFLKSATRHLSKRGRIVSIVVDSTKGVRMIRSFKRFRIIRMKRIRVPFDPPLMMFFMERR